MKVYGTVWTSHLPALAEEGLDEIPVTPDKNRAAQYAFEFSDPADPYVVVELEVSEGQLSPDEEAFYSADPPAEDPPKTWEESVEWYGSAMAHEVPRGSITVLGPVRDVEKGKAIFEERARSIKKHRVPFSMKLLRSIFLPSRRLY